MKKLIFLILLSFAIPTTAFSQNVGSCKHHVKFGIPSQGITYLCRLGYLTLHDEYYKNPAWVAYHLEKANMNGSEPRTDDYRHDPELEHWERSENSDYYKSGYDKGHMAPADVFAWSPQAMSESFLLSNMAPQVGVSFNRHIWKSLEQKIQKWAVERGELWVVTGPIYDANVVDAIGENEVAVPTHFFKVVYDHKKKEAIAFVLANKKTPTNQLPNFIRSVDFVEEKTGFDFLSKLPNVLENKIEKVVQQSMW